MRDSLQLVAPEDEEDAEILQRAGSKSRSRFGSLKPDSGGRRPSKKHGNEVGHAPKELSVFLSPKAKEPEVAKEANQTKRGSLPNREADRRHSVKKAKELKRSASAEKNARRKKAAVSVGAGRRDTATSAQLTNLLRLGEDGSSPFIKDLVQLPLLTQATDDFLKKVLGKLESKRATRDELIVQQGEANDVFIFVQSGTVDMYIGEEFITTLEAQDTFGELALLGLEHRSPVTLRCGEAGAHLGRLHRADFFNLLQQFPETQDHFERISSRTIPSFGQEFLKSNVSIFEGLSMNALEALESTTVHRIYFPGEILLEQGEMGHDMFMLVHGEVSVLMDGKVKQSLECKLGDDDRRKPDHLEHGRSFEDKHRKGAILFGERAFLSIQEERHESVVAKTPCHVAIFYRPVFLKILETFGEALEVDKLTHILGDIYGHDPGRESKQTNLQDIEMFQEVGCSEGFLNHLAQHLEQRLFLPGQCIVEAGTEDADRAMYIVNRGSASVWSGGDNPVNVATLREGDVFGEGMLLGLVSKRQTSVVAIDTSLMKVLTQSIVINGLKLYPAEKQKVLMLGYKKSRRQQQIDRMDSMKEALNEYKAICQKIVLQGVKKSKLFAGVNGIEYFVEKLADVSADRIYLPGEYIIEEGQAGDSMFVMVSGKACAHVTQIEVRENKETKHKSYIGVLEAGSISGELCLLGVAQKRSASIEAEAICCMWEVTSEAAMPIIQGNTEICDAVLSTIVHHLEHTVPACIDALPVFKDFDRKFRMLIGLYGERRACFSGAAIYKDNQVCDSMYVLNLGKAVLERKGATVNQYSQGAFFNAACMLGLTKRTLCTLTAYQTCHVVLISATSFQQALEQYPCRQSAVELKQREQREYDLFRKHVHRVCSKKGMWKQASTAMALDLSMGNAKSQDPMKQFGKKGDEPDINRRMVFKLRKILGLWRAWTVKSTAARKTLQHERRAFDDWVHLRRRAITLRAAAEHARPGGILQPVSALFEGLDFSQPTEQDSDDLWFTQPDSLLKSDLYLSSTPSAATVGLPTPRHTQPFLRDVAPVFGGRTPKKDRLFLVYTKDPRDGNGKVPLLPPSTPGTAASTAYLSQPPSPIGSLSTSLRSARTTPGGGQLPALGCAADTAGSPRARRPPTSGNGQAAQPPIPARGVPLMDTAELWQMMNP